MIGNDVVDLTVAGINSRWREVRFLDKIFNSEEQSLITESNQFYTIWRLWSMKESAYKIWARNKRARYNPKFFKCKIISETSGIVSFDNNSINTTTMFSENVIHTNAIFQNLEVISGIVKLEGFSRIDKLRFLKEKTIESYSDFCSISKESISIKKNAFGAPELFINHQNQTNFLSLSRHGCYGAFAISYE